MTTDHDPVIAAWFAESAHRLQTDPFTERVMQRIRFARYWQWLPLAVAGLAVIAAAWWLAVPIEFASLVARVLTTSLVDVGEGGVAWLLAPINSVAALLALAIKLARSYHGRIRAAAYAR